MTPYDIASTTLGSINAGINTGSWIGDLIFGAKDRKYNKELNEQAQKNYEDAFNYQKQQDALAQANFEAQMAFQQNQFEANRIGNLTKEYKEAGLNPFLAAGMGASTAGVVGGGASAGHQPSLPNTKPLSHYQIQSKNDVMAGLSQILMQSNLNEAEIEKLEAEADEAKANAEATRGEKKNLIETEIKEINTKIDKALQEIAESKAREKNINSDTEKTLLENQKLSNELIESNWRADVFNMIKESNPKKLTKRQEKEIWAELNAQHTENVYKTSATVKNYCESTCEIAQTIMNGVFGAGKLAVSQQSVKDMTRTVEKRHTNKTTYTYERRSYNN